tara:strand:- start:1091 stop:2611 length:1521 start_codon:yes stop_codon:yes gene_type:complete
MNSSLQRIGFFAGPLGAIALFLVLPDHYVDTQKALTPLSFAAKTTLCITFLMALWWLTEAIDLSATALLPIVLFPLLGVNDIKSTTATYASPLIFLFMGGFLIALALHRWKLDERLAAKVLRVSGTSPRAIIAAFMFTAAVLSAFISNTATTALMLPIGLSIIALFSSETLSEHEDVDTLRAQANFAKCLMLGLAYAASIGGTTTLIGTAPNLFLASFLNEGIAPAFQFDMSFSQWSLMMAPLALIFLPIIWLLLSYVSFPIDSSKLHLQKNISDHQPTALNRGQILTLSIFALTVFLWIFRSPLQHWSVHISGHSVQPLANLSDAGIAMLAACLLFIIPADFKQRRFLMDWTTATKLPWGLFILFGGGLALAKAIQQNGVASFIGAQANHLPDLPEIVILVIICSGVIFLTELTSNTATTATLIPLLAGIAIGLGVHPHLLIIPATLAASFAFMMPIATPPNAIVFGSGYLRIGDMVSAGLWLNIIAIIIISSYSLWVIKPMMQL